MLSRLTAYEPAMHPFRNEVIPMSSITLNEVKFHYIRSVRIKVPYAMGQTLNLFRDKVLLRSSKTNGLKLSFIWVRGSFTGRSNALLPLYNIDKVRRRLSD